MSNISAAAVPLKFSDGTEYSLSPLTDKEIDEIDLWLQGHIIEIARRSLSPTASLAEREETLSLAMREASSYSMLNMKGIKALSNIQGMAHICYVSLLRRHPNIKKDYLRELLQNPDDLETLNIAFEKVNHIEKNGSPSPSATKKKKGQQKLKFTEN